MTGEGSMKLVRGLVLGIVLGIIMGIVPARALYKYFFTIHDVVCIFDSLFSESMCAELRTQVQSHVDQSRFSLCHTLNHDFPLIKSVIMRQTKPQYVSCIIQACKPIFSLSDQKVLLENGVVTDKKNFVQEGTMNLFPLEVAQQKDSVVPPELLMWLNTVPDEVFSTYSVRWHDRTAIVLHNNKQPTMQLVCDYKTMIDKKMLSYCVCVLGISENPNVHNKDKGLCMTADLRFKDQIVLCKKRGDHG